jgi:prolyl oligopeptidase
MDLPQNVTVGVGSASETDDRMFVSVAGYLNPSSLYLADAASGATAVVKSLPAKFDATGMGRPVRGRLGRRHDDPLFRGP